MARVEQLRSHLERRDHRDAPTVTVPISRLCTLQDCEKRERTGIIRAVSADEEARRPSKGSMKCFTVVEAAKKRRRAIDHPEQQNEDAYANGYKSEVDLRHCPAYLDAVFHGAACVSDISASFYGYELPDEARQHYRFRDASGQLWESTRMMMGHTVAAELQHILTCIIAGHPDAVQASFAVQCPIACWIDNVRYHGPHNLVARARALLEKRSDECNVSFNIGDVTRRYEFIGIEFDHDEKTVRIAEKTRNKLPDAIL